VFQHWIKWVPAHLRSRAKLPLWKVDMEQTVTRDELVAHIDRVIAGAKRHMKSPTPLQSLAGDTIKAEVLMKFDENGRTLFCGKRFWRK
jgi:hypothetical protein